MNTIRQLIQYVPIKKNDLILQMRSEKHQAERGKPIMEKLKSRKFWMAIVTAGLVIANNRLGLNIPEESIMSIAGVVVAYILGQSHVDAKKAE
ncbi:hypothetical protein [Aneurinibacillus soli]|nr:hypothetical protein [Aneurinibacillus soli]